METKDFMEVMNLLGEYSLLVDYDEFVDTFGKRLGRHLWLKFNGTCQRNIVIFWLVLDNENRKKLAQSALRMAQTI